MRDWKAIARARGVEIPAGDLERTVAPLDALEEALRPLLNDLGPDVEPVIEFRPGEDDE